MIKPITIFLFLIFCANFAWAGSFDQGTGVVCKDYGNIHAIFDPNEHTCAPGYYLPANVDGCVACPGGYTCPGGTFTFDEFHSEGIYYTMPIMTNVENGCAVDLLAPNNGVTQMGAVFEPNEHTCVPGYYMPANMDGCVICPVNSFCPGGTYTFNEEEHQGINACDVGLYSPTGMWESAQCGRILHVGEYNLYTRTTKKTERSLHFDIDGDGVADYYANTTQTDVPMHIGTDKRFKIQFGDTIYHVHDDTINVE